MLASSVMVPRFIDGQVVGQSYASRAKAIFVEDMKTSSSRFLVEPVIVIVAERDVRDCEIRAKHQITASSRQKKKVRVWPLHFN